jgi:hypothetical protein
MADSLKNGGLIPSATALSTLQNQKLGTSPESNLLSQSEKDLLMQGEQEIDDLLDETDDPIPFRYSIISYGVDYPVDGLVKRIQMGDIAIPSFQRGFVWSLREASRFVESLLLGLPVPSIFLSKEADTEKLLVIDGQQRLLTLMHFHEGLWPITQKAFALKGITPQYEGFTYKQLPSEAKRRLADSIIHAIIVRQDQPSQDSSSIYHIFERLNTSGVSLTPQEIRTAIYHGQFSQLLKALNKNSSWRAIYGPPNRLMRDQELILRFLALYYQGQSYSRPMKGFLNDFMSQNRHLEEASAAEMGGKFSSTIDFVYSAIGKRAFKFSRVLNAALFDSIMVGLARRLAKGEIRNTTEVVKKYDDLIQSSEFREVAERSTADEENVSTRIALATQAFDQVQ